MLGVDVTVSLKTPRMQDCQRYWTVGGVLRNVPPGSGRRKSRSAASRETRKQASNLAATPESNAGSSETTLPAPENLMNSNPLASVLMSNMGLSSGAVQRTQTCGPVRACLLQQMLHHHWRDWDIWTLWASRVLTACQHCIFLCAC